MSYTFGNARLLLIMTVSKQSSIIISFTLARFFSFYKSFLLPKFLLPHICLTLKLIITTAFPQINICVHSLLPLELLLKHKRHLSSYPYLHFHFFSFFLVFCVCVCVLFFLLLLKYIYNSKLTRKPQTQLILNSSFP